MEVEPSRNGVHSHATVNEDVDLGALSELETSFYASGYKAGFEHGQAHGIFEGRALGQEKGFELWEELGYYLGQANLWRAVYADEPSKKRAQQTAEQLLALIDHFPAQNDSSKDTSSGQQEQQKDIEGLLTSIRSKYRVMCASFGVRPRLQAAAMSM